jgi:Zn-dependent peptidase ImmA (M78 family)
MTTKSDDKLHALVRSLLNPGNETPPIDVIRIAAEQGLTVRYEPMEETVSGMLVIRDDQRVIAVNQTHHEHRRRFTIAHELGHYFLHRDHSSVFVDAVYYRDESSSEGTKQQEIAANAFAAELLMPEEVLRARFSYQPVADADDKLIRAAARQFGVSAQALTIRLTALGLISV